ncbi:MAG TPA: FMN-binding protein [Agitococcus sp.]|nr:FMN-binding protein [Agitococcus sp.]
MRQIMFILCALCLSLHTWAAENTTDVFLKQYLEQAQPKMLWLNQTLKQRSAAILGHPYQGMRVRYWQSGKRTAWILDEIGKEQPITTGIVVENSKIIALQVLAYRESRGGEVQQDFFLKQFKEVSLRDDDKLNKRIDGITGATLSVWALQKVARLALLFDAQKEL